MRLWHTQPDAPLETEPLKRFDPLYWTVDFPRGTIASIRRGSDAHSIVLDAELLRRGDLVGLIWTSEDKASHRAHAYATDRDYRGCRLKFRWTSSGVVALDAVNGPTLTIEGRDASGNARQWYVRLWNYAEGDPQDAVVSLDFDTLAGGWTREDPVYPVDIDRMFVSIVSGGFAAGSDEILSPPDSVRVEIGGIECRGAGSVIERGSSWQPEQPFHCCTGYDDLYHLMPERVAEMIDRLGYGDTVTHYVGMSHYMALGGDGRIDVETPVNAPALAWNRALAAALAAQGRTLVWSLSYEILDEFCPEAWKQRRADGTPGLTGWSPPSALVSPANDAALAYLGSVLEAFVELADEAGMEPKFQIGEPWWWIGPDRKICLYDDAARAMLGADIPVIDDIHGAKSTAEQEVLDAAGAILAQSTATLVARIKVRWPEAVSHLLIFLPTILDPEAPDAMRANCPVGWARPAFDVLQLEDYDWVTADVARSVRHTAIALADARLDYPIAEQHYLAGFATGPAEAPRQWPLILEAAEDALERGVSHCFIWALPQVVRDDVVLFGKERDMDNFADVDFPIAIGSDASVRPSFSTSIVTSASGHEYRSMEWQQARMRYDAGPGVRSEAELRELLAFFRARRGPAQAFRFRDPFDFSSSSGELVAPTDQLLGLGDGVTTRFALVKRYGEGEERRITRPVAGSVRVAWDEAEQFSGWSLESMGEIVFDTAPGSGVEVRAGFLFDVPVRFAEDRIEVNRATFMAGEAPSVPLIEVRES